MKSLITTIFVAICLNITAQTADSVFIYKSVDDMEETTYYFPSRKLVCLDRVKDIGFSVGFFIEPEKSKNSIYADDIHIVAAGFGCVENVEIIFLLEDGTKIKGSSWNKFNCEGDAYVTISQADKNSLATKKLSKVRVTNGRNYKEYTADIEESMKDYFIQLFYAVKNDKVKIYEE